LIYKNQSKVLSPPITHLFTGIAILHTVWLEKGGKFHFLKWSNFYQTLGGDSLEKFIGVKVVVFFI
jgi:hypothetical protein